MRLMHEGRRWVETNPPITVYKGRDGRRSGVIAIPEEEIERSRPTALEGSARVHVTVHVLVMLDMYFVSVKYVFVSVKLVCVYVKLLKI
jgi:hypothetical protein